MAGATKFVFETDFRSGTRRGADEATVAAAREDGFREGLDLGRRETDQQTGALMNQLAQSCRQLLAQEDARLAAIEAQAAELAVAAARALAGAALADKPLAQLMEAARDCFAHARQASHLVVRVNEGLVETVEARFGELARQTGFAGRIVVLGEPEIAPGDGRIEWADGGLAIESARLDGAIDVAIRNVFGTAVQAGRTTG
jgi:flagellar assembly protein FliH